MIKDALQGKVEKVDNTSAKDKGAQGSKTCDKKINHTGMCWALVGSFKKKSGW